MKKLKLIYNPFSGNKNFIYDLDSCIDAFQNADYEVHVFKSMLFGDIEKHLSNLDITYDALVISGGDGSINLVVNSMLKNNLNIPLGIIPSGTANDFAAYLKLPPESDKAAEIIANGYKKHVDVGLVNDKYFINVCSSGLFTNVSQSIDKSFKNMFGMLAYYIKGIEQLPKLEPARIKITNSKETICENLYLYLVLNSAGTGGFSSLSPDASIDDGMFDFIGLKEMAVKDIAGVLIKLFRSEHLDDPHIIFFRDNMLRVEIVEASEDGFFSETDCDGEAGPMLPIEIKMISKAIEIFVPYNSEN